MKQKPVLAPMRPKFIVPGVVNAPHLVTSSAVLVGLQFEADRLQFNQCLDNQVNSFYLIFRSFSPYYWRYLTLY